jgi:Ni/Fe-hydrogenase subunit HybB-like protein
VMAIYLCVRSLNARVDLQILSEVSRVIAPMLIIYGLFRAVDLATHGGARYLFMWREETWSFWLEIGLFILAPVLLLSWDKVRNDPQRLYWTCALVVMGFMTNRLNVAVTGLQASSGVYYVPKWTEFALTIATVAVMVVAFRYAVIYLDILPKNPPRPRWTVSSAGAEA